MHSRPKPVYENVWFALGFSGLAGVIVTAASLILSGRFLIFLVWPFAFMIAWAATSNAAQKNWHRFVIGSLLLLIILQIFDAPWFYPFHVGNSAPYIERRFLHASDVICLEDNLIAAKIDTNIPWFFYDPRTGSYANQWLDVFNKVYNKHFPGGEYTPPSGTGLFIGVADKDSPPEIAKKFIAVVEGQCHFPLQLTTWRSASGDQFDFLIAIAGND